MLTTAHTRINWDDVYYAIRTTLVDVEEDKARHKMLAARREVGRYEYLASLLTRAVQETVDFTYQETYDWKAVYTILTNVCEDFEKGSRDNWKANALKSKRDFRDYTCATLTRYVAEVIDFKDYMSANGVAI